MLTIDRRTIDGFEFEIGQLQVKDARAVLVRLTRVLGPALTKFAGQDLGSIDVAAALGHLMGALTEEDLEYLCAQFGKVSKVQIGPQMVAVSGAGESIFQGKMLTMFRWIWACIQANYADFLGGLQAIAPLQSTTPRRRKSKSPPTSTGKSGESSGPATPL